MQIALRTGLLAKRAKVVERAWVRVAREAVGAKVRSLLQSYKALRRRRARAPGPVTEPDQDQKLLRAAPCEFGGKVQRLREAPELHEILADVRGSLPLTISRLPVGGGAVLKVAERPHKVLVLGSKIGGAGWALSFRQYRACWPLASDVVANETFSFVEQALEAAESVLIHSVRGQSRSCCVMACYMMKKYAWGLRKTMEFLSSRRPDLELKPSFLQQLLSFERRLVSQSKQSFSSDWSDCNLSSWECEELLLRNTYINSQMGPLAEIQLEAPGQGLKPQRLAWMDAGLDDRLRLEKPPGADRLNLQACKRDQNGQPVLTCILKRRLSSQNTGVSQEHSNGSWMLPAQDAGSEEALLPLWQRPDLSSSRQQADQAVNSVDEEKLVELQRRTLPALPATYLEPVLAKDARASCLAARPGPNYPLLLVGDSTGTVALYDVDPNVGEGQTADKIWSLSMQQPLVEVCWGPGGGCFAVATGGGRDSRLQGLRDRQSRSKGVESCCITIWSVHSSGRKFSVGELIPAIRREWGLRSMCFCNSGFRIAVAASAGPLCTVVVLFDADTLLEECRLVLPKMEMHCIGHSLSSTGVASEHLILAADRRVLLWGLEGRSTASKHGRDAGASDLRQIDAIYWDEIPSHDLSFSVENESLQVLAVHEGGLAHQLGVRGASGWLLAGWRSLDPTTMGKSLHLQLPRSKDEVETMLQKKRVLLRLQPPDLNLQTLDLGNSRVLCAAASPDNTLLAVGCERGDGTAGQLAGNLMETVEGAMGSHKRRSQRWLEHSSTLSVWSLETQELWRAKEVPLNSSIPALCWLDSSMLVVALTQTKSVGLVNAESGALLRRWFFNNETPQLLAAADGCHWVAVGFRSQRTGRAPAHCAVFDRDSGGGTWIPCGSSRARPVVACSDTGNFLAVAGADLKPSMAQSLDASPTKTPTVDTTISAAGAAEGARSRSRGLSIWQIGDMTRQKVSGVAGQWVAENVALDGDLLVACFQGGGIMKAFRLPDEELCTEEHAHTLQAVAAKGDDPTSGVVAAAGPGVHSHKTVVGLACWISRQGATKANLTFSLPGAAVAALAFLPGHTALLAGGVNLRAMAVACIWNLNDAGAAREICEVRLDMGPGLRCLAIGHDGSQRHRDDARRSGSPPVREPRSGRRPSQTGTGVIQPTAEAWPAVVLASSGSDSRIVVHEVRCGFRTFFDISEPTDADLLPRKQLSQLAPSVLRFANSGRLLAAGDNAGRVHLFLLGRHRAENDVVHMRVQAHRVLSLSGHVCDVILKGEQLFKAVCLQHPMESPEQEAPRGDRSVLVYDLLNPSLEFMLPDLKMKADDASSAFCAQLEMLPSLLHQQLPQSGWMLLHCCACRGQAQHARLLVRLSASPFQRDAVGRNALDVALQHHEFGVVEDLMMVLMEQRHHVEHGHAWDQFGENAEILGRALLACSLPAEHQALTQTVVRLLRHRMATLPDFLDTVCCGVPRHFEVTRAGEKLKVLPSRAALKENEFMIRAYSAPVFRPEAFEFQGLVPTSEDVHMPERPVEIRVWYLRGALDDDVGFIPALKESEHEEIMRTKFVHVLLEEQWAKVGRRQFRLELVLYLIYLVGFAGWCITGRASCADPGPPEDEAQDFNNLVGFSFQMFRAVLVIFQLFFLYEEWKQLAYEVRRAEAKSVVEKMRAVLSYFTTWNNLDIVRIALVSTAVVWSVLDRAGTCKMVKLSAVLAGFPTPCGHLHLCFSAAKFRSEQCFVDMQDFALAKTATLGRLFLQGPGIHGSEICDNSRKKHARSLSTGIAFAAEAAVGDFGRACPEEDGAPCQDVALTFWAFGAAGIVCRALPAALSNIAQDRAHQLNMQNVSNVVQASSTLLSKGRPLPSAPGHCTVGCCRETRGPQEASNAAWDFRTLVAYDAALLEVSLQASAERLSEHNAQELSNTIRSTRNSAMLGSSLLDAIGDAVQDTVGAGLLFVDAAATQAFGLLKRTFPSPSETDGFLVDVCALGWSFTFLTWQHPILGKIRDVVREELSSAVVQLAEEPRCGRGFVHRLDVPSSGLLLVATSFLGYAYLEWQMYTYQIVRDYVVAGHSLVAPTLCLRERILNLTTAVCSERGRPAETYLRLLCCCVLPQENSVSLLAVRIRTGRRHQIRVHLQSVCPSVADHRYGVRTILLSHAAWPEDDIGVFLGDGKDLLAVTTVFVCSRLISFLRAFPNTGHLVRTLITIFWDMAVFFRLMLLMLLTFVFAFLLLYDQPFSVVGIGEMMWYVYVHGVFGDADPPPGGADDSAWVARLMLMSCVVVMLVVMMNFLIAIMGDSYDKVQERAEEARNVMRLELVYEAEVANVIPKRHQQEKAYVFTCEGVRYAGGGLQASQQEASRWEGRVRQVEKAVRRETRQTWITLTEQSGQLAAIEDRIFALESHVNQGHARLQETLERLLDTLKNEPRTGASAEDRSQKVPALLQSAVLYSPRTPGKGEAEHRHGPANAETAGKARARVEENAPRPPPPGAIPMAWAAEEEPGPPPPPAPPAPVVGSTAGINGLAHLPVAASTSPPAPDPTRSGGYLLSQQAQGVSRDSPYRDVPAAPRLAFSQGQPSTTSTGTSWASQALQRGPSNKDPLTGPPSRRRDEHSKSPRPAWLARAVTKNIPSRSVPATRRIATARGVTDEAAQQISPHRRKMHVPCFTTGDFKPHHLFLEDAEYGRALDALVKAVSDILVTSPDGSHVFLGKRKVHPQPDWWFIGGRAKPGETPQQAASRNLRRELGLEVPSSRLKVIGCYSLTWAVRAQAPADHGTADISTVHSMVLHPEEERQLKIDEEEYADLRWHTKQEVLTGEFHPVLKQAIRDLQVHELQKRMEEAVEREVEEAELVALARMYVAAVKEASQFDRGVLRVDFDEQARSYVASCLSG
ncbi:Dual specificity protein phosphatase 1B [Symbiodinium microadriaticum]|uniref:Dual specificity protein phosphatase 1B n=2 Tax=Symbiodinium TaxID=2949 RepID=A0A1Q9EBL3_SYMMI|nr:Dual specificity protein phosphatase 1B [Symbiodinium microadriaticum]